LDAASGLVERKIGALRPWAWGPDSVELLEPLLPRVTAKKRAPGQRFNRQIAKLYSKAWSTNFLKKILVAGAGRRLGLRVRGQGQGSEIDQRLLLTSSPTGAWLCTLEEVGVAVDSLDGALDAIAAIRRRAIIACGQGGACAGRITSIRLWETGASGRGSGGGSRRRGDGRQSSRTVGST